MFCEGQATSMLGERLFRLEEIERDTYKGRDVWRITLGYPPDKPLLDALSTIEKTLGVGPFEYKLFLIDAADGDLVAMKLRGPSLQ